MNHIVFQSKCQGYSHIKSDLECQDSTLVKKTEKYTPSPENMYPKGWE